MSASPRQAFAVIIGINTYISDEIPDLQGAVNDATLMKSYLSEDLLVPDSHIVFLTNHLATREAIVSAFEKHLVKNSKINDGDTIIIFYAGHGSRTKAPTGWIANDDQIENILPHDVNGNDVHSIPDRTVNALLRKLANSKGNNITVIFDCCHSGGLARKVGPRATARSASFSYPIPEALDREIWSSDLARSAQHKQAGFRFGAMSSHVLLAACQQSQNAYEITSADGLIHGAFTQSLIQQLRQEKSRRTTNSALIKSLNLPTQQPQQPQCEGTHKDRAIFDGKLVSNPKAFRLTRNEDIKTFQVDAGRFQGVVCGTEFVVQIQETEPLSLGILKATAVGDNSSTLAPRDTEFNVPEGAMVVVSTWKNELKVFIHPDSEQQGTLCAFKSESRPAQSGQDAQIPQRGFVRVHSQSEADVVIRLTFGELYIERRNDLMSQYANKPCISLHLHLSRIPPILDAIAHFNYYLGQHHGEGPLRTVLRHDHDPLKNVQMALYRLITNGFRVPDNVGNLLIKNEATLAPVEDAEYGIEITNGTEHDLFPYLFYFDPSDYSIQSWYLPPSPTMDPPLRRLQGPGDPGRVTAGYGAGGGDPFEFLLKPGELSDTGFLKLFVSANYVDMDWIAQESPFESSRAGKRKKFKGESTWGSGVAAITVVGDKHC